MRTERASLRGVALGLALAACGGTPTPPPPEPAPQGVLLAPPGTRLRVRVPSDPTRQPHTLRYRVGELELRFADARVEPGRELEVAEAYLAQLTARHDGEVDHRPFALAGQEGLQITIRGDSRRVRALILWRDGAISRLAIHHPPSLALDAERVIETLSIDDDAPLDPRAALELDADPVPDLPLLRVSTEQLLFREGGAAFPFPSQRASVDVVYVPFVDGEPPPELERGRLLGAQFRGLDVARPILTPLGEGGGRGFTMQSSAMVDDVELQLYGAWIVVDEGALLMRASVAKVRSAEWLPRFDALAASLRVR